MGCRHSTQSNSKHFVSSIRTISMHAEEMLANELIHDSIELKKRRAMAKLKSMHQLKRFEKKNHGTNLQLVPT